MKDHELDHWLQASNTRLVARLRADIDMEARRRLVLDEDRSTEATRSLDRSDNRAQISTMPRHSTIRAILSAAACVLVAIAPAVSTGQSAHDFAVPHATSPTSQTPTSTVPPIVPSGYQQVTGPPAIKTVVPVGWSITAGPATDVFTASDAANATKKLRYGRTQALSSDIVGLHLDYENQFAAHKPDYQRVKFLSTTFRGMAAVEWEFEYDTEGSSEAERRHVSILYWLDNGYEYFIYASAPAAQWATMAPIFATMVEHTES